MPEYRIKRVDKRNIAIQELRGKEWRSISYHGNNVKSLIDGLSDLMLKDHSPNDVKLTGQLKNLKLEIVSATSRIERIVKEYEIIRD